MAHNNQEVYEVVLESSCTVIVVSALVKEDETGPHCEHILFLHKCFFDL
jgi:hypothetical protein